MLSDPSSSSSTSDLKRFVIENARNNAPNTRTLADNPRLHNETSTKTIKLKKKEKNQKTVARASRNKGNKTHYILDRLRVTSFLG